MTEPQVNILDISFISKEKESELAKLLDYSSKSSKFLCQECHKTPEIEFKNFVSLNISCDCAQDLELNQIEEIKKYIINISEHPELNKYIICETHGQIFQFYCNKLNSHFCKDCKQSENVEGLKDFITEEFNIKEKILFIAKCLFNENNNIDFTFSENSLNKEINEGYLKNLISTLINEYFETPNITIISNIIKFYQILQPFNEPKNQNDVEINAFIEIKSLYEYNDNKDKSSNIKKIAITETNLNINILRDKTFDNLEELNLEQNLLEDINVLTNINCNNLKELNLRINKIADNMIPVINSLIFPELEKLDLSNNYFKSFKVFKAIEHFTNLKKFKINSNPLTIFDENDSYNLESIEKINVSNGAFSEIVINKVINKFRFRNLKSINLNSNSLKSLSFLKGLELNHLEKIKLANNEIKDEDLNCLNKFRNLKKIDLGNNCIHKIDSINKIINDKSLDLKDVIINGNQINLYSENNVDIEEEYFNKEIDLYLYYSYKDDFENGN